MKKIYKKIISIMIIVSIVFPIFSPALVYAEGQNGTGWDNWELTIEQQMMNSYRLHAAETNVNNLQSTKVQNVTEVIGEYDSTDYLSVDITPFWDETKKKMAETWKQFNQIYRDTTGFAGIGSNGNYRYEIVPYNSDTKNEITKMLFNWKTWTSGNAMETEMIDKINSFISSNITPKMNETLQNNLASNNYEMVRNKEFDSVDANEVRSSIKSSLLDSWSSGSTEYNIDIKNTNWFTLNYSGVSLGKNSSDKYYISSGYDSFRASLVQNSETGFTFNDAIGSANPDDTVFGQVMINLLTLDTNMVNSNSGLGAQYGKLRVELTEIIAKQFILSFGDSFWNGSQSFPGVCGWTDRMIQYLGKLYNKVANIQLCQFKYQGTVDGCWFKQRSAYYFPFTSGDDMQMGFEKKDMYNYLTYKDTQIDSFMKNKILMPVKSEIKFPDTTSGSGFQFLSWLVSSIIVRNELNKYEYWAENLSNENDTTYYGEPQKINLSNEKDPNLMGNDLQFNPAQHWGVVLFTRYKYVDYTYYMYYPINDATRSSFAYVNVVESGTQNIANWGNNGITTGTTIQGRIGRTGDNVNNDDQTFIWVHAWTNRNHGEYWVNDEQIQSAVSVVEEHLAAQSIQTESGRVGLIWGSNQGDGEWSHNNFPLRVVNGISGYGDYYRYDEPVRAEVKYFQVRVPDNTFSGEYNICIGDDDAPCKSSQGCFESTTLCTCEDEFGGPDGCELSNSDFDISSTLVE